MTHEIHAVTGFEKAAPFTLRVHFEDRTVQTIDFRPVLAGEVFGPLSDSNVFDQVCLDNEGRTLVWSIGLFGTEAAIAASGQASSSAIASARFKSWSRDPVRLPT